MGDQIGGGGILSGTLSRWRIWKARRFLRGKVLDYGCGCANLAKLVGPNEYFGFEVDPESLAVARSLHPRHRFGERLPANSSFDTIVCLAVIEHAPDPGEMLDLFRSILSDEGHVVLSTPSPPARLVLKMGARIGLFSKEANEEHKELIGIERLKELCGPARLRMVHFEHFMLGMNQSIVLEKETAISDSDLQPG